MRIRQGFVSNSSSTSFCVFGVAIERDSEGHWEDIEAKADDCDYLTTYCGDPNDWPRTMYVGIEWDRIDDDETGQQFKDRVAALIEQIVPGEGDNCTTHEESYYDG